MTHIQNTEKQPAEAWVCKAPEKVPALDSEREQETIMVATCDFVDPSTAVVPAQQHLQESQPQDASTDKVSTLSSFLQSCMKLLRNQNALKELHKVLAFCEPQRRVNKEKTINRVQRTGREMRLNAQIGEYDMTDVILDLGSEVNVLTKQTWEQMGKPTLGWSPIQLRLANQ